MLQNEFAVLLLVVEPLLESLVVQTGEVNDRRLLVIPQLRAHQLFLVLSWYIWQCSLAIIGILILLRRHSLRQWTSCAIVAAGRLTIPGLVSGQ